MAAKHDVKDLRLAPQGLRRLLWADRDMPVLREIRARFAREKPLKGLPMAACLHITAETAALARALQAGGADLVLCASNPLSTQDDVAAALVVKYKVPVHAVRGEDHKTYYRHLASAIRHNPRITMDDGADLVSEIHARHPRLHRRIIASMEETTTGVIRLRAMERDRALKFPVIAVNDAHTKYLFDNRYGTGQSTLDGILRATGMLFAGRNVVVAGYGWCGRGFAMRARGMGANVIVTEVDHLKALEAVMDGYRVMTMREAAPLGDLFCTLTGDIHVIRPEHFRRMKNGAVVCNSGHFDVEIDIPGLKKLAKRVVKGVRPFVDEYVISSRKSVYLLAEGRLVNLAAAEGHPASVMDMSFATQALAAEWAVKHARSLEPRVYDVPRRIEEVVSRLKLASMDIRIDSLTPEQKDYLSRWDMGT
ncbi:MAG: adenosylhomocysteinase [Planctomycetota bacterium]